MTSGKRVWARVLVPEMWASLAIAVIWLAVLLDALLGPNIVSSNDSGTTSIPSAVVVAIFAYLAVVSKLSSQVSAATSWH